MFAARFVEENAELITATLAARHTHVDMDEILSFPEAHAVAEEITAQLQALLKDAVVIVHPDLVKTDGAGKILARPAIEPPAVVPE